MSNAIVDASLRTRRLREQALYAWQRDVAAANSLRKLQTSEISQEPVAAVALGAQILGQTGNCACTGPVDTMGYRRKVPVCF